MKLKTKIKIVILILLFVIGGISGSYYESKVTEVYLAGKVVAFDLEDVSSNMVSSGLVVNASYQSIGTMTFIKQNGDFAALGHPITENVDTVEGECYEIQINSIQKSTKNRVGQIIAEVDEDSEIGNVYKQSNCGIFGTVDNISNNEYKKIQTENRYNVETGAAYILIDIDGTGLQEYEVEITGIDFFSYTKNLRISVTSQELIKKTGGIVQGMSGTPIVQNGKLIGAINSVDISSPTKAYGIFIDKLL